MPPHLAGGGAASAEAESLRAQIHRMQEAFAAELEAVARENEELRAAGGAGGADVDALVKSRDELQKQVGCRAGGAEQTCD